MTSSVEAFEKPHLLKLAQGFQSNPFKTCMAVLRIAVLGTENDRSSLLDSLHEFGGNGWTECEIQAALWHVHMV